MGYSANPVPSAGGGGGTNLTAGVRYVKTLNAHLADSMMDYYRRVKEITMLFPVGSEEHHEEYHRLIAVAKQQYQERIDLVCAVYQPSGEYTPLGSEIMRGAKAHRKDPEWYLPDGTCF